MLTILHAFSSFHLLQLDITQMWAQWCACVISLCIFTPHFRISSLPQTGWVGKHKRTCNSRRNLKDRWSTRLDSQEVAACVWEGGFLLPWAALQRKRIIHCKCLERSQLPDWWVASGLWLRLDDDDTGNMKWWFFSWKIILIFFSLFSLARCRNFLALVSL